MNIVQFILDNSSKGEIERMRNLVCYARKNGCALLVLKEKHDMMRPCYEYMTIVLENAGIRVRHVDYHQVSRINKELFMAFANIWILKRNTLPLTVKKTPWIALQTEHPHHRVGNKLTYHQYLQHCDQVWDFGLRFFPRTRSIFFPHMFYPSSYMTDVPKSFTFDIGFAGKMDSKRSNTIKKMIGRKKLIEKSSNVVKELGKASICPMIPRQDGNFEIHRFSSLISSGTFIIAEKTHGNEKVERLFGSAVEFVPRQVLCSKINHYINNPDLLDGKREAAQEWFIKQEHEQLLKKIMEGKEGNITKVTDEEAMKIIRGYIERREPFSMVRFGEGEGRVLGISKKHPKSFNSARMKMRHQTGIEYPDTMIRPLKNCIMHALCNATMIGTIVNFKCEPNYVQLMNVVQANVKINRTKEGYSVGQFVSRLLQNHLDYLAKGRTMMSVITCRDLKDYIQRTTGIEDVKEYIIPSQHIVRTLVDGDHERKHYGKRMWPDLHDEIKNDIVVREQGELFIVAAGLFGKDLCITIQEKGGIAIDMGSSVDFWVKKRTRGKNKGLVT